MRTVTKTQHSADGVEILWRADLPNPQAGPSGGVVRQFCLLPVLTNEQILRPEQNEAEKPKPRSGSWLASQ